ncbi:hypothetical protein U9M48_013726, partial [Paspalum notatum var. saurae]
MSKDLTSKMHLKMKLVLHKLQESGSVPNHLTIFKEIVSDLQAMKVKYEDEDLGLILLCSLCSSFTNFRDTILYSRDTFTLNNVCEALQAKEKIKQMVSSHSSASNGEALAARGRTEKKSNKGSRVKSGGSVKMGDDRSCQIVGIGSVQIKMHDGIVRTLTDVRHIPDMTKNLISLSTLDGKGYKYSGGDGVLKVSKGSLVVMKADLKSANLYRLRGTTITGIVRHYTIPHTLQQKGVAERMNRTIISRARCILSNAGLNKRFWAEAASTAYYLINRSASITLDKKTPIEVWSGFPADYSQLRVFGCIAYAHVDNGKLEPRAIKCIFLGYQSGVKVVQPPQHSIAADRSVRTRKPTRRLIEECNVAYALSVAEKIEGNSEPSNYSEAIISADCNNWVTAMQDEMESLDKNAIYLLLYVDDMLIAAKEKSEMAKLKARLKKEFEMNDLCAAKKILGMEIIRDRKSGLLYLSQLSSDLCRQSDDDIEYMSRVLYSSAVGSLMYAMFGKSRDGLVGYIDSNHARDLDKRRSLTDQMFHERTKYIDVRYHFIRGVIAEGGIK